MSPPANTWDGNSAFNDRFTWDFSAQLTDTTNSYASNTSYGEFGVQRYVSLSVTGNPSGSIPPGSPLTALANPSVLAYSSNSPYRLNVSIPHLYKNGNPASSDWIPVGDVWVHNMHSNAFGHSGIAAPQSFPGEDLPLMIWGTAPATIPPVGNGTVSAGPDYSDYTAAAVPEPFEYTIVQWYVAVDAGTPEGIYWATISITIWA
jgi:hypothetical protein